MWKILCITFLCHMIQAQIYKEHVKVTELTIMPNNGVLDYNEEKGEIEMLMEIGFYAPMDSQIYYTCEFENLETGEWGTGGDRICGNLYRENRGEDQRVHTAIVNILRGQGSCPWYQGDTFKVKKVFFFIFYDDSNGILINCANNTAEVTLYGPTKEKYIGKIAYNYYITGPKCDE